VAPVWDFTPRPGVRPAGWVGAGAAQASFAMAGLGPGDVDLKQRLNRVQQNLAAGIDLKRAKRLMRTAVLLDGRNVFDPEAARALGFDYAKIGRP